MKVCSKAAQIRQALTKIKPTKIAVAYIGHGWKSYVSKAHLKEIVLSPTPGSNPKAIEEIMSNNKDGIGSSNVYFLDKLHSKIYLSSGSALLGSANLSDNGLADSGQLEAAIILTDSETLEELESIFEEYKVKAKAAYPTIESKEKRLRELYVQWQVDYCSGNVAADINWKPPTINNYSSSLDRIHIAWWSGIVDSSYDEEAIAEVIPESLGGLPSGYFDESLQMLFLEEDEVKQGHWILMWRCNIKGYPTPKSSVKWLYVNQVVSKGYNIDNYTKLVGQAKESEYTPPPPFDLDEQTVCLIRKALADKKFKNFRSSGDEIWRLAPADADVPNFLEFIRNNYEL